MTTKLLEAAKDVLEEAVPSRGCGTPRSVPWHLMEELAAAVAEAEAKARSEPDREVETLLVEFRYHLKHREYFGAMSDSPGPWRQGERDNVETIRLAEALSKRGYRSAVEAIWDEMAPGPYTRPLLNGGKAD